MNGIEIDLPGRPTGDLKADQEALYRYLSRTAAQLNYALSFIELPEKDQNKEKQEEKS